jgi:RNA-directed DNA polymerase
MEEGLEMNVGTTRGVPIEYRQVEAAYNKVRQGGKAAGVDKESWELFDKNKEDNLYLIWNRMSSGSYHPQAVREVEIPKKDGKSRKLGIPTLKDRIAQEVVKEYMEERIDKLFHDNSYGYRPMKSAKQAIEKTKEYCYKYNWVIDMDIANFFDEIDHELMLKAVEHVLPEKWVRMYVERWLKMPIQKADGSLIAKEGKGTPQGGVISPLLANLFLHYTLDAWLPRKYPEVSFVRYADDTIIHCRTKEEAEEILEAVQGRLAEVKLRIKETKTKIVYCKDYRRKGKHEHVQFEFLGFSFQPRPRKSKVVERTTFMAFTAEISQSNQKRIREIIARTPIWRNTTVSIDVVAGYLNPQIRGWINYYGFLSKNKLRRVMQKIDLLFIQWIKKKYKVRYRKAFEKRRLIKLENPNLFYHWESGYS